MKKVEHPEDCIRFRNILLELGYDLNLYEVERFWIAYSDKKSAGWLRPTTSLKQEIKDNLIILNEIPFLQRA